MTWDDFERALCFLVIAGTQCAYWDNRLWWTRTGAIEAYNRRWPWASLPIPGVGFR
jgi:hypothetical protein